MRANPSTHNWADKISEEQQVFPDEPLFERHGVRVLLFSLACLSGFALAVAAGFHQRRLDDRRAEFERERRSLVAFAGSPEFALFLRALDQQFVSLHNAITAHPQAAQRALAPVATFEKPPQRIPWPAELMPLPAAAATDPLRVHATWRATAAQLAQRGHRCEADARQAARGLFVQLLAPHARRFLERSPTSTFPRVTDNLDLQEVVLAAAAAHHGPDATIAATERHLALLATLAPALQRAIDESRTPAPNFAQTAR